MARIPSFLNAQGRLGVTSKPADAADHNREVRAHASAVRNLRGSAAIEDAIGDPDTAREYNATADTIQGELQQLHRGAWLRRHS